MSEAQPTALATVEVLRPGAQTTLQDLGRPGYQHWGVPVGGAMDRFAARLANLLVGNDESAAVLETTMAGPVLRFSAARRVAVCGATFEGIAPAQPFVIPAGETLSLAQLASGCRGYLAVAGGFSTEPLMGSASTYLRGGLGGIDGRALRAGDVLRCGATRAAPSQVAGWRVSPALVPNYSTSPLVRVLPGAQWEWLSLGAREAFFKSEYRVSEKSDRVGLRLWGAALELETKREMKSEAVAFGSIQVPPDGQPIVLMADRQTIGGYPRIADVITVDLPLLAQVRPGDCVRFESVSLGDAEALYLAEEHGLAKLRGGLAEKLR